MLAVNYWPPQEHAGNTRGAIGQLPPSLLDVLFSSIAAIKPRTVAISHVLWGKADDVPFSAGGYFRRMCGNYFNHKLSHSNYVTVSSLAPGLKLE